MTLELEIQLDFCLRSRLPFWNLFVLLVSAQAPTFLAAFDAANETVNEQEGHHEYNEDDGNFRLAGNKCGSGVRAVHRV